jgi:hypothetical protein
MRDIVLVSVVAVLFDWRFQLLLLRCSNYALLPHPDA